MALVEALLCYWMDDLTRVLAQVPVIVDETIINGRIIPELLRAAVNVPTEGGKCFHDW
jgi:hypothetical protein